MKSTVLLTTLAALALSTFAVAQQNSGVQAQGQGSVQGNASVERGNGGVQSQATGSGSLMPATQASSSWWLGILSSLYLMVAWLWVVMDT